MPPLLTRESFEERCRSIQSFADLERLRQDCIDTENVYRELFARQRDSWQVPEIEDDPYVFLVSIFDNEWTLLSQFPKDVQPRVFPHETELQGPATASRDDFLVNWDCFTEGLLRFVDMNNVFCAGGAVAGCAMPLPERIQGLAPAASRVARRQYFHDEYLPGSDVDLFLYGLNEKQAEAKLLHIYDAIQAANPFPIRAFRSAHAVTLVSQYPFRHIQIVLRLYHSPAEVLMGFDVDACAVGFDGQKVVACPRTVLALRTRTNRIDVSRRSPSYEMRLSKYASRGFAVVVPDLIRPRIDPFLYEKRFDQVQGLARLLLLERLRTPEERLRYRLERSSKNVWSVEYKLRQALRDKHNLYRSEQGMGTGAELSDYSTVFLPWGPDWNAKKIEKQMKKKDRMLNKIEFLPNGRVTQCMRKYKIHVCAVGTMEEVLGDPFPDDPPIPEDTPETALEGTVRGAIAWLVDNPGRQQIGSFHPLTADDWMEGAYFSRDTEELIQAVLENDAARIRQLVQDKESKEEQNKLLRSRDFLGRSALHVATLAHNEEAFDELMQMADNEMLKTKLSDGRNVLHLACARGFDDIVSKVLAKRVILMESFEEENPDESLDIDGADWETKLSPLQYAVIMGQTNTVKALLDGGANARKIAVHKDEDKSISILSLLAIYASECGETGFEQVEPIIKLLLASGASPTQVDAKGSTCWHYLAASRQQSSLRALEVFLAETANLKVQGLDVLDSGAWSPLYTAVANLNSGALAPLLRSGAKPFFEKEEWDARISRLSQSVARFNRYSLRSDGKDGETLRCPVFAAVVVANPACITAFVQFDETLANSCIHIPAETSRRRHYSRFNRNEQQEKTPCAPLDILNRVLFQAQKATTDENVSELQKLNQQEAVDRAQARLHFVAEKQRESTDNHYLARSWSLIKAREQSKLDQAQFCQQNSVTKPDEDAFSIIEQIEESRKVLVEAGGKPHPDGPTYTDEKEEINFKASKPDLGIDPINNVTFMKPITFLEAMSCNNFYAHRRPTEHFLSEATKATMSSLFKAIPSMSKNELPELTEKVQVCISDHTSATPFFLAILYRKTDLAESLMQTAKMQFKSYMDKLTQSKAKVAPEVEDKSDLLKEQLRRMNNLDIAAGETPKDSGPSGEQIRDALHDAEAAVLEQEAGGVSSECTLTGVPPESLLLNRSVVLMDEEPDVLAIKTRLYESSSECFPKEWLSHPVRLRPLELAVLRRDTEMVRLLLRMAENCASMPGNGSQESDNADAGEESARQFSNLTLEDDVACEDDDDDDEDEDMDDDYDYTAQPAKDAIQPLTKEQIRCVLVGSSLEEFGNLTLVQVAIAVDDTDIFEVLVAYGGYYTIPRSAVCLWKKELEGSKSDEEKTKLEQENSTILGTTVPYYVRKSLHIWGRRSKESYCLSPTMIQFALALGSTLLVSKLLAGDFDSILLQWMGNTSIEGVDRVLQECKAKGSDAFENVKSFGLAAKWLLKTNASVEELASRLIRPTALDGEGRSALFYASAKDVPLLVNDSNDALLESTNKDNGVTPLMAATSAGDVDKVRCLLQAGCKVTTTCGPFHWGPFHLALSYQSAQISKEEDRWQKIRELILVLKEAPAEDVATALQAEGAEHTPFMVALQRGADKETLALLMSEPSTTSLQARDSELNSCLHIAVKKSVSLSSNLTGVQLLLEDPNLPDESGPEGENSRGLTPKEMAMDEVSSVWSRVRTLGKNFGRKIVHVGNHSIPLQKASTEAKPHAPRATLHLLQQHQGPRVAAEFDQVQIAKERKATQTSQKVTGTSSPHQEIPNGPPSVLVPHNNYYRRSNSTQPRLVQWEGWHHVQ